MTGNTVQDDEQPCTEDSTPSEGVAEAGELIEDGDIAIEVAADEAADAAEADAGADGDGETGPEEIDPDAARIAALEAKVAELETAKADTYDRLLRSTADFDNFRKRSRRDMDDARVDARSRALKEILPIIDNLERAMSHAETAGEEAAAGIMDGVKLVMRQFAQALARLDVVAVEAAGKPFDPSIHEAISQMPTPDHEPGTVAAVVQTGYKIGGRLLRPAMVVVATAPPEPEPAPESDGAEGNGKAADMDVPAADEPGATADDDNSGATAGEGGDNEAS